MSNYVDNVWVSLGFPPKESRRYLVNFNDLTATSLELWLLRGPKGVNYLQIALFEVSELL